MSWSKVKIGELLLLEKGHEMQQIVGVGRQRIGRTPTSTKVLQEACDTWNGLVVIIEQLKGFVIVFADMVDAHGSLAPFLASKHPFLSRTHALWGFTCPHNSETAFEKRFQALLRSAWQKHAWHLIVADPGSGKTTGIIDLVRTTGSPSGTLSGQRYPILAVACPKDDEYEQTLGDYLYRALRLPLKGHWRVRKGK